MESNKTLEVRRSERKRNEQNMAVELGEKQLRSIITAIGSQGTRPTITNCSARFNGSRFMNTVENFITQINIYKEIQHINDKDAIEGLPLLLEELQYLGGKE